MGTPMLPTLDSSRGLLPENNINFGSPWPVSVIFRFASKRIVRDASFPSNQVAQDPPQRKLNFLGQRLVAEKVRPCQWTRHWRCVTPLPWCHGLEKVSATGIGRGGTWSSHRDDRMTSFKRYVCCLRSFLGHQKNHQFHPRFQSWSMLIFTFLYLSRSPEIPRLHSPGYSAIRL